MRRAERFVHLHVHGEYSLLDGAIRVSSSRFGRSLSRHVKSLGMNEVALTDHGNMCGALEFYRDARKEGMKAILGMEAYLATGGRAERNSRIGEAAHLTLLAKDEKGYRNLVRLSSLAHEEGFHYRARIDRELLARYHEGLIVLSGCMKGELSRLLLEGRAEEAERIAGWYRELLGEGRYFLEIQDHGLPEQKGLVRSLLELGRKTGIPAVVTNDAHYLGREDALAHDVLLCIQTGKNLQDPDRMRFQTTEFYLKSPAEMAELFAEIPDAVERSWEIAERCGIELVFADDKGGKLNFPGYPIPADAGGAPAYLRRICEEGVVRRYGTPPPEVRERLDHELEVIDHLGFVTYFLIVWDIVRNAKERGILVGPGRGSAAGSLVSYVLGITDLDPLKYGLIFERFLNPGRKDPPDIDIDFPDDRRGEVVEYVMEKYGARNVSQIGTFSRMNARAVVRDVGRVMGMSYGEVDRLAKLIPTGPQPGGSSPHTLASGMETPEVKAALSGHEPYRKLCEVALSLEGLARHVSTHAAGIVIAPPVAEGEEGGLRAFVPMLRLEDDEYVTQYDMDGVKYLGLLKIDLLGLATLTVLDGTRKLVKETRGVDLDFNTIPLDDGPTYAMFAEGRTDGIFQFESSGMRDALRKLHPDRLEDLIALNALYRPGPMEQIDPFIKRSRGNEKTVYEVPELEPILKTTHGVIVYQEQVLQVVHQLAGYTLGEADDFRRSMGKKVRELMERQEEMFVTRAKAKGITQAKAEKLFEFLEKFAGYGFNRSHSAAYALLAYWTAYLKTHFTVEFMAALLTSETGSHDKVSEYVGECRKLGLKVNGPDVNRSLADFSVEPVVAGGSGPAGVRFGLAAIKNVGESASNTVVRARSEGGPFGSLYDFCGRMSSGVVNRKVMECLIRAGAFDSLEPRRERLMAELAHAIERGARNQEDRQKGQESLFGASEMPAARPLPDADQTPELNRLADEKELLGCYVTGHPLAEYADDIGLFASHALKSSVLADLSAGTAMRVAGIVSRFKTGQTKQKKETYARFRLEDLDGSIEVMAWPNVLKKDGVCLHNGAIVLLSGRLEKGDERPPQLIANDAMFLEEAPVRLTKAVHLKISAAGADEELLKSVQKVAGGSPGDAALVLHFATLHHGEAVLEAGPSFRIRPTRELLSHLKALLGEDRVTLAGTAPNGELPARH